MGCSPSPAVLAVLAEDTSGFVGRGLMSSSEWEAAEGLSMAPDKSLVAPPVVEQRRPYGSGTAVARAVQGTCSGMLDREAQAPVETASRRGSESGIGRDSYFAVCPSTEMKVVEVAVEHRAYRRGCCSLG